MSLALAADDSRVIVCFDGFYMKISLNNLCENNSEKIGKLSSGLEHSNLVADASRVIIS